MWWAVAAALCMIVDKGKEGVVFFPFNDFHGIKYP
jgi:hypothetical protein